MLKEKLTREMRQFLLDYFKMQPEASKQAVKIEFTRKFGRTPGGNTLWRYKRKALGLDNEPTRPYNRKPVTPCDLSTPGCKTTIIKDNLVALIIECLKGKQYYHAKGLFDALHVVETYSQLKSGTYEE